MKLKRPDPSDWFKKRVAALLEEKQLQQKALISGSLDQTAVSRLLGKKRANPTLDTIDAIAAQLKIGLCEFFGARPAKHNREDLVNKLDRLLSQTDDELIIRHIERTIAGGFDDLKKIRGPDVEIKASGQ